MFGDINNIRSCIVDLFVRDYGQHGFLLVETRQQGQMVSPGKKYYVYNVILKYIVTKIDAWIIYY